MVLCCPSKSKITLCLSSVFKILMRPDGSDELVGDLRNRVLLVLLRNGEQVQSLICVLPRAGVHLLLPAWPL